MLPLTIPGPNLAELSYLSSLASEEVEYQRTITQAREYDSGVQFVALTDRLREFLGGNASDSSADYDRLRLNVCRVVLAAVVERLVVTTFTTDEAPINVPGVDAAGDSIETAVKPVEAWAWQTWQANRMDAKQRRVHRDALRDGEAFVLVDWDNRAGRARFTPHARYVDGSVRGDGQGCRAFYRNDDPDQDLLYVTKQWTEVFYDQGGRRTTRRRLTVYKPDTIEKYAGFPGAWRPVQDDPTEAWPIRWVDAQGRPLGIPVAHFVSSAGMEAREAWPLQNAINKALVDLMQESDVAAFRIMLAFGWKPVDANGVPLVIEPGRWMGSENPDARAQEVAGTDLTQFMNMIEGLMFWAAMATDTPVSRFITTKAIAAEGTQKEQEGPLLTKARNRQGELGNGWEDCMRIALRLQNTFGRQTYDDTVLFQTTWEPLESRNEDAELARAKLRKDLGMPIRLIAEALGLTPDAILRWEQETTQRQDVAAAFGQQDMPNA